MVKPWSYFGEQPIELDCGHPSSFSLDTTSSEGYLSEHAENSPGKPFATVQIVVVVVSADHSPTVEHCISPHV